MSTNSKKVEEPFEDILYERGFSLTSVRDRPKRRLHNNPLIVAVITGMFLIMKIISIITPEDDIQTLLLFGDVGHFFGIKLHYNMVFIFASIMELSFQH